MRAEILSQMIELGQGKIRSLDCTMAQEVSQFPEKSLLMERIKLAQGLYPETNRHEIEIETHFSIEAFSNIPLKDKNHLVVALIEENAKRYLTLKMSHVLGDALSMLLWLKVIHTGKGDTLPMDLRNFPPKKDSPYRSKKISDVWMKQEKVTPHRRIETREFTHPEIPRDIKLNDILILALLRALPLKHRAIWVPVNVREHFTQGFGNGLSRLRIYPTERQLTLKEELTFIRRQKTEAIHNGEVALPPSDLDLSSPIKRGLFKLWLNRPWADWASISLSHVEDREGLSPGPIIGVTNLLEKHFGALFAFTQNNKTIVTLTFDATIPRPNARNLIETFGKEVQDILNELNS